MEGWREEPWLRRKLMLCTRYTEKGASSRLRFHALVPYLEAAGFSTAVDAFFPGSYLEELYASGRKSRRKAAFAVAGRLARSVCWPKDLFVEYELLPFLPYTLEAVLLKGRRYVLNFDDDIWEKYADCPELRKKLDTLCRNASGIVVANEVLREKAGMFGPPVCKIPTALDLKKYAAESRGPRLGKLTAVWIGTPVTEAYLEELCPVLKQASSFLRLRVIGAARGPEGIECECLPWSEESEARLLAEADFGLMPLPDTPFARGKSSYKILQYFASGLPVLASPVGENSLVVTEGTGFLPASSEEWLQALEQMKDAGSRAKMGEAARKRALDFSLALHAPRVAEFLLSCLPPRS